MLFELTTFENSLNVIKQHKKFLKHEKRDKIRFIFLQTIVMSFQCKMVAKMTSIAQKQHLWIRHESRIQEIP